MSQPQESGDGVAVAISSEVMIGAVVFLFMVVVFVFLLYLYARRYLGAAPAFGSSTARFIFVQENGAAQRRGLDPAVLQALPITYYSAADFREPLECAVCLSELADGEKARILPRCSHGFHLECIDMWFHSNSTCPLCRCPVGPEPAENLASGAAGSPEIVNPEAVPRESPILPTNVLFWGNLDQINTGSSAMAANGMQKGRSSSSGMSSSKPEGMLVIEIPRRAVEGFPSPISPLPSSRMAGEEMKTPPSARLRSLRRLLSRGKRAVGTSCSPRGGGDIEQGLVACGGLAGEGSAPTPRTPTGLSVV